MVPLSKNRNLFRLQGIPALRITVAECKGGEETSVPRLPNRDYRRILTARMGIIPPTLRMVRKSRMCCMMMIRLSWIIWI